MTRRHHARLHVEVVNDGEHVRISRGIQFSFLVRKNEAVELADALVDAVEQEGGTDGPASVC